MGWSRRNFMVPLPRFASLEALNGYLEQRCRERQSDVLRGHRESIAKRLERDLEAMTARSCSAAEASRVSAMTVSVLGLPPAWAHRMSLTGEQDEALTDARGQGFEFRSAQFVEQAVVAGKDDGEEGCSDSPPSRAFAWFSRLCWRISPPGDPLAPHSSQPLSSCATSVRTELGTHRCRDIVSFRSLRHADGLLEVTESVAVVVAEIYSCLCSPFLCASPKCSFLTNRSRLGLVKSSFSAHSPVISSSMRARYVPGTPCGSVGTGRTP